MARQPFNTRWAQGVESQSNPNTFQAPPAPRLNSGWEGGQDKDAPPAGQENWWHNRVDSALQDLERKGAMAWHAQAVYGLGAPCYASDGYYYESLANNNTNNSPLSSSTYWRQIGQSLYSSYSVGEYKDVSHNGTPDTGWLKCTGAVLLRTAYPKLFAKIGTTYNVGDELSTQFRIPDWRGLFPRFLDDGRGIDANRTLGNTAQPSQNLAHGHGASAANSGDHTHSVSGATELAGEHSHGAPRAQNNDVGNGAPNFTTANGQNGVTANTHAAGNHAHQFNGSAAPSGAHTHAVSIGSSGGTEARSINLAQVRWIRYL